MLFGALPERWLYVSCILVLVVQLVAGFDLVRKSLYLGVFREV